MFDDCAAAEIARLAFSRISRLYLSAHNFIPLYLVSRSKENRMGQNFKAGD
jgi:hypothetical protein